MTRDIDLSRVEYHVESENGFIKFEIIAPWEHPVSIHTYGDKARDAIRRYHLTGAAAIASADGAHDLAAQILALRDGTSAEA